ncbi:F-box protein-like protein [Tanacetum coccineum]
MEVFYRQYVCLMDDTLAHQQELDPTVPVLIKELNYSIVVGSCNGLFCVYGVNNGRNMVVLWNPSVRKCVGIVVPPVPYDKLAGFGFGVCPVTNDPMIVRIPWVIDTSKQVEFFTLSSGVWNVIPSSNMYRDLTVISATHVVINRFIYWVACERIVGDDGLSRFPLKILSFDMITKDFKVVDVPYSLGKQFYEGNTISKLSEERTRSSSSKRFGDSAALEVYSPSSKHIHNLGIYGERDSFMGSHMETLPLRDHADCLIYDSTK